VSKEKSFFLFRSLHGVLAARCDARSRLDVAQGGDRTVSVHCEEGNAMRRA